MKNPRRALSLEEHVQAENRKTAEFARNAKAMALRKESDAEQSQEQSPLSNWAIRLRLACLKPAWVEVDKPNAEEQMRAFDAGLEKMIEANGFQWSITKKEHRGIPRMAIKTFLEFGLPRALAAAARKMSEDGRASCAKENWLGFWAEHSIRPGKPLRSAQRAAAAALFDGGLVNEESLRWREPTRENHGYALANLIKLGRTEDALWLIQMGADPLDVERDGPKRRNAEQTALRTGNIETAKALAGVIVAHKEQAALRQAAADGSKAARALSPDAEPSGGSTSAAGDAKATAAKIETRRL